MADLSPAQVPTAQPPAHSGAMLAFMLDPNQAAILGRIGDYRPDHLTLVYLTPDANTLDPLRRVGLWAALKAFGEQCAPLTLEISGHGRFETNEGDGTNAVYASVDSPELPGFRQALVELARSVGIEPILNHGFTPHITLGYIDSMMPTPQISLPGIALRVDKLSLVMGGSRADFPLTGSRVYKAANYGARAGQVIAGNLGRGQGGRFARAGAGGPAKPAMSADMPQDFGQALGLPAGTLGALSGMRAGKPVTPAQAQALIAAGLAKEADGGIVMTGAARSLLAASKRGDVDAARAALERAKPKPRAPKGGGKAPKAPKPTREQVQAENFLKVAEAAAGVDDPDLARDFLAFAKGGDFSTPANAQLLAKMGLVEADSGGAYRLSTQGRAFVNAALRGDTRRARDAMSKITDRAAPAERPMQKSLKDRIWDALVGVFAPEATGGLGASLKVFKDAAGAWRWVALSSNSYQDRDGEIVSQKALEADVARADGDGDYGPLLFWHDPRLVLGDCDFNAMSGRMLVESGTFKSAGLAEAIAGAQARHGMSIGFRHPRSEPGAEGVFKNIRRFERSLLPLEFASNPYTAFSVKKGNAMDQKKRESLAALIGEAAADELIAAAQTKQASNDTAGVRTKEAEAPAGEPETAAVEAKPEAEAYVADLKAAELVETIKATFAEAVAHILAALKEQQDAAATKAAGEQAQELVTTKAALGEAETKIKQYEQLIGELPRAQQRAYRPIGDKEAEVSEEEAKKAAPAADVSPRAWLYGFVAGQPEGAQPN